MAVSDGQRANAQTFNDAFLSRTQDSDTVAIIGLNHPSSGGLIPNAQQKINDNTTEIVSNDNDIAQLFLEKEDRSEKDQPNGYAGLDGDGKILASALPFEAVEFKGAWDASTNTPTLVNGTGDIGDVYRVSVAGSQDLGAGSENYSVGDWVTYNGTVWERSDFVGAGVIDDLSDVDTSTNPPTSDNEVLGWDTATMKWIPKVSVSQENLTWLGQGAASWDATSGDLVLDSDCYLSIPGMAKENHTIQAQTINLPSNDTVAYITIDREATVATNRLVNVISVGTFLNDGNNIVLGTRINDEFFLGLHNPQRFQDGDQFDISKGGGGFTGVREANVIETKILSSSITGPGSVAEIGKDDLIIGKTYEVRAQFTLRNDVGGSDADVRMDASHDGVILARSRLRMREAADTSDDVMIFTMAFTFVATATSITMNPSGASAFSDILGNGLRSGSFVEYELRNDLDTNLVANSELSQITGCVLGTLTSGTHTANGAYQPVLFNSIEQDTFGAYNTSTGEFTAWRTGKYSIEAIATFAVSSTGSRFLRVYRGASQDVIFPNGGNATTTFVSVVGGAVTISMTEGETITIQAFQSSGGNLAYSGDGNNNHLAISYKPNFSTYGVVNPESEYLETIYADSTGDINSPTVYVAPGPSAFELPIPAGTWDIGYAVTMVMESLGGTGTPIAKYALHLDGTLLDDTTTMISTGISSTSNSGNYLPATNTTRITVATASTLSLRVQAFTPASIRNRMASITWTGAIGPGGEPDSSPKIWARRVS